MKLIAQIDITQMGIETYVKLYDDHVEIKKIKPDGNYMERSIPLFDIERVDVKPAGGFLFTGIIQFIVKDENKRKVDFFNLSYRDDCLNFSRKYNDTAREIKSYIEQYNR